MSEQLTSRDLREALREHAHFTSAPGSSYAGAAREIGSVVLALAVCWVVFAAPTMVDTWIEQQVDALGIWMTLMAGAVVAGWAAGETRSDPLGTFLRFPAEAIARVVRAAVLLCGVATIGAVALVPGAYLVHLLNLN